MVLPGDEIVPSAMLEATRAITINAYAEQIWPWLIQIGQGRAGFYSDSPYRSLRRMGSGAVEDVAQFLLAQTFVAITEQSGDGEDFRFERLLLYLGYAAGVGKTYRMLEDAQQLARQGKTSSWGTLSHTAAKTLWQKQPVSRPCPRDPASSAAQCFRRWTRIPF